MPAAKKKPKSSPPPPRIDLPVEVAVQQALDTIRQAALDRMKPKFTAGKYAGIVFSTDKQVAKALEWAADEIQKALMRR